MMHRWADYLDSLRDPQAVAGTAKAHVEVNQSL